MLLLLAVVAVAFGLLFSRYGGLTGGKCADTDEFAKYAGKVDDICVPEQTRIVALGEATHGNVEFQQLKLEVFKLMVEKYGVRAFALEADYGGCEAVNRYIHGGKGSDGNVAVALGFTLYNTEQMEQLIDWMRQYNEVAAEGEDLRFYGFDMQSMDCNYRFMVMAAEEKGVDVSPLKQMWNTEMGRPYDTCSVEQWAEAVAAVRDELAQLEGTAGAVHHADILIQNCGLGKAMADMNKGLAVRDGYMAVRWILAQEDPAATAASSSPPTTVMSNACVTTVRQVRTRATCSPTSMATAISPSVPTSASRAAICPLTSTVPIAATTPSIPATPWPKLPKSAAMTSAGSTSRRFPPTPRCVNISMAECGWVR